MLLSLQCRLNTNLFSDCVELTGYCASAVNVVSSNLCVGPSPRIEVPFFLLSICADELISAPELMTFFPERSPADENSEREWNPMQ